MNCDETLKTVRRFVMVSEPHVRYTNESKNYPLYIRTILKRKKRVDKSEKKTTTEK